MKLSFAELKTAIATYVAKSKVAGTFSATYDNIAGLVDKIAMSFTLDGQYVDQLEMFDGFDLPYGKTLEEWFEDLIQPQDYDSNGANTLAPSDPTYRPNNYSVTLGKKVIKTTKRYNDYERAFKSEADLVSFVSTIIKRLYDSFAMWKYGCKKQGLSTIIEIAEDSTYGTWSTSSAYAINSLVKSGTSKGIVVKALSASHGKAFADAVAEGYVVVYNIVRELAVPVDTSTGEAFVKQLKLDVEQAKFAHEGSSLNGNTLGSYEGGLVLLIKKGVMPTIDVDVLAGAFHQEKLLPQVEIKIVDDFGTDTHNVYAMLMDRRGMFFNNCYRAVKEQENAEGNFVNFYLHSENSLHVSRNTFVKIYQPAE